MMKINRYIKYLPILILLAGINVYAQTTGNLNQIIYQAQQEASGLSPFFNLSFIINSPIITSLKNALGSSFLGFAIPFLFVFGVLIYITYEAKKEINRPLLLIYFIIDLLATIFFPAILILLAIILAIVLLLFGFYKLFHTVTRSTIGSIAGVIITTLIFFAILFRFINNSTAGLLSLTSLILLSIFFLILIIYALLKIKNKPSTDNIKKLIYHIHKPEDVRKLKNMIEQTAHHFENDADQIKNKINNLISQLPNIGKAPNVKPKPKQIIKLLEEIKDDLENFYNTYKHIKRDIKNYEIIINAHYNEPLRGYLLNILNNGEKRINLRAQEVRSECSNKLLRNKNLIMVLVGKNNQNTVNGIYTNIEDIMKKFHIY
ncbi:MAG: hypothetical protein L7G90_01680 [Candidatus Nanopusillus sp.]|nr:hypothetical protein [Candidatus Nanopusillus sp.]